LRARFRPSQREEQEGRREIRGREVARDAERERDRQERSRTLAAGATEPDPEEAEHEHRDGRVTLDVPAEELRDAEREEKRQNDDEAVLLRIEFSRDAPRERGGHEAAEDREDRGGARSDGYVERAQGRHRPEPKRRGQRLALRRDHAGLKARKPYGSVAEELRARAKKREGSAEGKEEEGEEDVAARGRWLAALRSRTLAIGGIHLIRQRALGPKG